MLLLVLLQMMMTVGALALAAAAGAVATLAAQWLLLRRWLARQPPAPPLPEPRQEPLELPECLAAALRAGEIGQPESCVALNLILQFLFRELRHSPEVLNWFHKKLSAEFAELLTRTTTGKLFDSVIVREVQLGSQMPVLRSLAVREARLDPEQAHLEQLDLCVDLHYSGGFQLAVDANMLLGKAASLAVKVTHLSGPARLQFQRHPYTHWSFSFYSEPRLELAVESQFQGRPLPQVTSLIINQIRKSLKKKHTLPNYKLRYKPFFRKPVLGEEEEEEDGEDGAGRGIPTGTLKVSVLEVSRLNFPSPPPALIYCSLAVDACAWVEVVQRADQGSWLTLDAALCPSRGGGSALGLVLAQRFVAAHYQPCVVVETVVARSAAAAAGVRPGDVVLAVDGRRVASLTQAARALRAAANAAAASTPDGPRCVLRLERRTRLRSRDDAHPPVAASSAPPSPAPASPAHPADHDAEDKEGELRPAAPDSPVLRRRKLSADPSALQAHNATTNSDTDSGSSSPASVPGSPAKRPSCTGNGGSPEHRRSADEAVGEEEGSEEEGLQLQRTADVPCAASACGALHFDGALPFTLRPHHRYLNVSVWGRSMPTQPSTQPAVQPSVADTLLGHVSVPLRTVVSECGGAGGRATALRPCALLPPDPHAALDRAHPLSAHSGFEPCLCYGDVLLAFRFLPSPVTSAPAPSPRPARPVSPPINGGIAAPRRHDFVRTHFHRATQCEFCGKKIWLKDAVQCRDCGMTCHKKCVSRCQEKAVCAGPDPSWPLRRASAQPEIVTTAAEEEPAQITLQGGDGPRRGGLGGLLATAAAHARGLRRAGSANNLALAAPGAGVPPSRSLPPSPQRSPQPSRKASLAGSAAVAAASAAGPFALTAGGGDEEDVEAALERLLAHPNDDDLMAAAKTTGKQLYADLPLRERKERINNMISKLKAAMEAETRARAALEVGEGVGQGEAGTAAAAAAARAAFLAGKSEERVQALAVLMLHFCAGLQSAQDQEDALQRENAQAADNASKNCQTP